MKIVIFIFALVCGLGFSREEVEHLKLESTDEIERAELYLWRPEGKIKAVMVFCPGLNGSGEYFVKNATWQKFAKENGIALCGLSFASPFNLTEQKKGYSYVDRESGKILLSAIDDTLEGKKLPLLIFGYSGGARFTASFLAWKPERVLTWCASGVGNWPELPKAEQVAPGIVACGEYDAAYYWNSLNYFQSGRKKNYPWVWISLENTGHGRSKELEEFVRLYFHYVLKREGKRFDERKFDIATNRPISSGEIPQWEIFSVCLPADPKLTSHWLEIHHP